MGQLKKEAGKPRVLDVSSLPALLENLYANGFDVIGPTVRDGAIVLDSIRNVSQLPIGWSDEQSAGHYRVKPSGDGAAFGYSVGPRSWKEYVHPSELLLWSAQKENGHFRILNNEARPQRPFAFFGVRACDLAAIRLLDRIMIGDQYHNPPYEIRRAGAFVIAVQCTTCAETCFCASLGTGPGVTEGFDLCLTELAENGENCLLIRTGTDRGGELLAGISTRDATDEQLRHEAERLDAVAKSQKRAVATEGLKELLDNNADHEAWQKISSRCLTCANCTMVCPTCFCTTVEDSSDLSGAHAERWRRWDSCFTLSFSYIHGGSVRASTLARYRQWVTHKFSAWVDQFGSIGCVGCGRCITWCPVGIDITESVRVLREGDTHGNS